MFCLSYNYYMVLDSCLPLKDFPDACLILDDKDQIVGINPAGEKLLKMKQAEVVCKSVDAALSRRSILVGVNEWKATTSDPGNGRFDYMVLQVCPVQDPDGNFLGRITVLRDLNLSTQTDSLRNQNAILTALQETTSDLHSSLDVNTVLCHIVERACKLMGTTHGYLDILRETGELEPVVGIGALAESLKFKVAKGEGVAGTVWKTGKPLVIDDYDQWSGRIDDFSHGAIRAVVGMPLLLNEQVIGVIGVAHGADSADNISENDVLILERFADLAVIALQNARIYEKAQQEIEFRRETEIRLRNANQVLQLQIERIGLLQKDLQELAVRDPLTELYNRRYLTEALELELAHPERSKHSMAILMMDSDRLKDINDKHGHKAGDDFLIRIAGVIKENIRAGDIACRYGGDEYVILMNNVTQKDAYRRAEDLRKAVAEQYIVYRNEKVNISISVGIAMFPAHGRSGSELLHRADQALYEAKRRGKNCVVVFSEEQKE